MNSPTDRCAITLLERTVIELKNSVKLFVLTSKGQSAELDRLLDSMLTQLDTEQANFTFSQLVAHYRKRRKVESIDKEESFKRTRIETTRIVNSCLERNLSTTQVDLLTSLVSMVKDYSLTDRELLKEFASTLLIISDDIEMSRELAHRVVDENHKHIKQNSADIVAADIQTSSRRLTREIAQLSKQLITSYPSDITLKNINDEANLLVKMPNQFFKSLELLQDLNKHISTIINRERLVAQEMLIDIQSKIFYAFTKSKELSDSLDVEIKDSKGMDNSIESKLQLLQKQAADASSVDELQGIINKSITSLTDSFSEFSEKQRRLNLKNKSHIRSLSGQLQNAHRQVKTVQNKLDSVEEEVLVDQLSQLGNRKGYIRSIRKAYDLWRLKKQKLSVVIFDIDKFKNINDTHGHAIGDQVIKKIGSIVKESVRTSDYIARYGGEEFVIICNDTNIDGAALVAEKVRRNIAKRVFKLRGSENTLKVTSSFGIAEFTEKRSDISAVFNAADKAMYEAKQKGRNRAVMVKNNRLVSVIKNKVLEKQPK
jgi:diguanylate cyclase (GGDEF)-like protein